jgi:acetate---CoA ligase (ADP-forming)
MLQTGEQPASKDDVNLAQFFNPRSMVVFGSTRMTQAAADRMQRFGCPVTLVNPKGGESPFFPIARSAAEVGGDIDLAMIRTQPKIAIDNLEECGKRGIPFALVFSAGFSEVGGEGEAFERRLDEVARKYGIRVMGPNTNENAFEALPVPLSHRGGLIGLVTQSGHNGRPVVQGVAIGAGFSRWVPTGNEVDLELSHFLRYFAEDQRTTAIAGYIEGFRSIPRLRSALEAVNAADKPVVMLKIGATEKGAETAVSHTGHMTGSDKVIDALLKQYGVTRVQDLDELLETTNLFAKLPLDTGRRVALYSISGGSGTLMTEIADYFGTPLPPMAAETQRALHDNLIPTYLTVTNPIDNGGAFVAGNPQADRIKVLDLIAADPNVDIIVVGLTGAIPVLTDNFADDLLKWAPTASKPVIATWNSYNTEHGYGALVESGVPIFRSFRSCFSALNAFRAYQDKRKNFRARKPLTEPDQALAAELAAVPGTVSAQMASRILADAGVRMAGERIVASAAAAADAAQAFGRAVAMKLMSPAFPHKSDVGLVRLGVTDAGAAYNDLIARADELDPGAVIDGVLVQEQIGAGVEMIVGLTYDGAVGSALTIGAGGIYAEILADVAVRPLPVDRADVREMIAGLKISKMLAGARGKPPVNVESLIDLALAVARLAEASGGHVAELDLNPVIVSPERAVAVDSLMVAR